MTFNRLGCVCLLVEVHLAVHGTHINPDLQVGKDLAKFGKVLLNKLEHSLTHNIGSRKIVRFSRSGLSLAIKLLLGLLFTCMGILTIILLVELLCSLKK